MNSARSTRSLRRSETVEILDTWTFQHQCFFQVGCHNIFTCLPGSCKTTQAAINNEGRIRGRQWQQEWPVVSGSQCTSRRKGSRLELSWWSRKAFTLSPTYLSRYGKSVEFYCHEQRRENRTRGWMTLCQFISVARGLWFHFVLHKRMFRLSCGH